jgi:hypothetical protein
MGDTSCETDCRTRRGIDRLLSVQDPSRSFQNEYVLIFFLVNVDRGAVARA